MGRQTRQQRRAQERRNHGKVASRRISWPTIAAVGVVLAAVALFASQALGSSGSNGGTASPLLANTVDGIKCGPTEGTTYHVHAHLTLLDHGNSVALPAGLGIMTPNNCLYWLHTHNPDGVIHIEAPVGVTPTLGTFFDIWGEHLSRTGFWYVNAQRGQPMKVFVNGTAYAGNPRSIRLTKHTTIALEVGPPFRRPTPFHFGIL